MRSEGNAGNCDSESAISISLIFGALELVHTIDRLTPAYSAVGRVEAVETHPILMV